MVLRGVAPWLLVAAVLLAGRPVAAQADDGVTPHKLALAQRYVAALQIDVTMENMMASLAPSLLEGFERQQGKPLPQVRLHMNQMVDDVSQSVIEAAMSEMIPAVASSFSDEELEAAVDYYESPPGRSLMAKIPVYHRKMAPIQQEMLGQFSRDFQARLCLEAGRRAR
jgi:hypothetical protein